LSEFEGERLCLALRDSLPVALGQEQEEGDLEGDWVLVGDDCTEVVLLGDLDNETDTVIEELMLGVRVDDMQEEVVGHWETEKVEDKEGTTVLDTELHGDRDLERVAVTVEESGALKEDVVLGLGEIEVDFDPPRRVEPEGEREVESVPVFDIVRLAELDIERVV